MELYIAGDVRTVLEGKSDKASKKISLRPFAYALGAGLYAEKEYGETIVLDNVAHVHTIQGKKTFHEALVTPFLMGFPQKPSDKIEEIKGTILDEIYRRFFEKYPEGFLVYGEVDFTILYAAYLKRSPVYRENCNRLKKQYWQEHTEKNVSGKIVGVIAKKPYPEGFYVNPNEQSNLLSHSHTLVEETAYHLLTQSEIAQGTFYVSPIDRVTIIP